MPPVKRSSRRPTAKRRSPKSASRRSGPSKSHKGLQCPDCDFVAKHPMGLGRHRSTRHGAVSQRQARRQAVGGWLTRREAARRAGVHYNTIRHWEGSGRLRRSKRRGSSGTLVNAADLDQLMVKSSGRGAPSRNGDGVRIQALERKFDDLLDGLERLVSTARNSGSKRRAGAARGRSSAKSGR